MDLQLACVAEYISRSAKGHLNILGLYDEIHAHNFPAKHASLIVVVRFKYSRSEVSERPIDITYRVVNDDGKPMVELRGGQLLQAPPSGEYAFWEHQLVLNDLVFEREGDYSVDVVVNGSQRASVPIKLRRIPGDPGQEHGTLAPTGN